MKSFVIDIYTQTWDDMGMEPIEDRHLKTVTYKLNKNTYDLSIELEQLLAEELNNGYSFTMYEFETIIFIRVEIFFRSEYKFLVDYFDKKGELIKYPDLKQYHQPTLIQVPNIQKELRQELKEELRTKFGSEVTVSASEMIYEKGFSNWDSSFLVWIAGIPASVVGSYIYDFIKNKWPYSNTRINYLYNHNEDDVKKIASDLSKVSQKNLKIIEIKINEEEESVIYFITSRYADIQLTFNKSREVINYKIDEKTQTQI